MRLVKAAALLLFAVLVFHRQVLFDREVTFPWDFGGHHLPLATAYADALSERELPLWDPFTYCGRPLLANPQAAVFYPGMVAAVLPGREGLLERLEWLAALHVVLGGIFVFFLARKLGMPDAPALAAALAFELGAFFTSQAQHLSAVCAAPWLVLSWLGVLWPSRLRVAAISFSWSMSFFLGFTAFTLMTCLATAAFAVCHSPDRRTLRDLALSGALALGMVSVQLGPALELVSQSVGKYRTDWMGSGGGVAPGALIPAMAPGGGQDPSAPYLYFGLTVLILAAAGLGRRSMGGAALCLVCLVLMLGQNTPVGRLAYGLLPQHLQRTVYWYLFLAPLTAAMALLAGAGSRCCGRWAWLACLAVAADLTLAGSNRPVNTGSTSAIVTANSVDNSTELPSRLRKLMGGLRVDTGNDGLHLMAGAPILRWRAANGYDPLALEAFIQARGEVARTERWGAYYQVERPDSPALDWMSVRVLTSQTRLKTSKLREAGHVAGRWVYLNPAAMPRYRAEDCRVEPITETRNRVELSADCRRASMLETSETHYSEWKAEIDGRAAPVTVVHKAFRGVALPSGRHRVVFRYDAGSLLPWVAASLLFWCAWLAWLLYPTRSA